MFQIAVNEFELDLIRHHVSSCYQTALSENAERFARWNEYYRRTMLLMEQQGAGSTGKSKQEIPLVLWHLQEHISAEHQAIFGPGSRLIAEPNGDSDGQTATTVGHAVNWDFFHGAKIKSKWPEVAFNRALYGRAFVHRPFREEYAYLQDPETGEVKPQLTRRGMAFEPINGEDFLTPVEDVRSLHEFSFVEHRQKIRLSALLDLERKGRMFGIKANYEKLAAIAQSSDTRAADKQMNASRQEAEGVQEQSVSYARDGFVEVIFHYGYWNFPLDLNVNTPLNAIDMRNPEQSEVVFAYQPDLQMICSVEDLREMYPTMVRKRPFWETALNPQFGYWCPGYGKLLLDWQKKASDNERLNFESGRRSVIPIILKNPNTFASANDKIEIEPGFAYDVSDAASVKVINSGGDTTWCDKYDAKILAITERVTGRGDLQSGRQPDRPNAPKTATQTMALLETGNTRMAYNSDIIAEDVQILVADQWEIIRYWCGERFTFRITERSLPPGIFGGAGQTSSLTAEELAYGFDFTLKFAPSELKKLAEREDQVALFQSDMVNPIIASNPRALWARTKQIHSLFGNRDFATLVPEPPQYGIPRNPEEEWARMSQGEDIHVNPMDADELHLQHDQQKLQREMQAPNPDMDLIRRALIHIAEHKAQAQRKLELQAVAAEAVRQIGPRILEQQEEGTSNNEQP